MEPQFTTVELDEESIFNLLEDDIFWGFLDQETLSIHESYQKADLVFTKAIKRAKEILNPSGLGGIMSGRKKI